MLCFQLTPRFHWANLFLWMEDNQGVIQTRNNPCGLVSGNTRIYSTSTATQWCNATVQDWSCNRKDSSVSNSFQLIHFSPICWIITRGVSSPLSEFRERSPGTQKGSFMHVSLCLFSQIIPRNDSWVSSSSECSEMLVHNGYSYL